MEAVLATLHENYVRPDESNAAQSKVALKGKHRFIDKVHVRYVEKEKRHWAALENFNSQRIAIGEKFYRDTDRLLEGGIWRRSRSRTTTSKRTTTPFTSKTCGRSSSRDSTFRATSREGKPSRETNGST